MLIVWFPEQGTVKFPLASVLETLLVHFYLAPTKGVLLAASYFSRKFVLTTTDTVISSPKGQIKFVIFKVYNGKCATQRHKSTKD